MLKKLHLKKSTSIIVSMLFLLMLTAIIVVPVIVNGKTAITNTSIRPNNEDDDNGGEDDDGDHDGVSDHDESENERNVEIDIDGTEAEISSESETGEVENSFQVFIHAESDKLSIEFQFESEVEENESETEFELAYEIAFTQLIGYNDTDGDNIYDPTIDTTVETYNIGGFNDIQYTFENRTDGELHILSVQSTDGIFGIVVYVTNEFITINDTIVTPTEVKFDILINGFVGNFTRVALKTDLEFEGEVEIDEETEDEEHNFADNETELALSFNDYKGFFSWSQIATTDGVEHPVYVTPFDPVDVDQIIYLNYVAGNKIIHDPKVGVNGILIGFPLGLGFGLFFPELSRNGFLIVSGVVALIALSGSLFALRRKRK